MSATVAKLEGRCLCGAVRISALPAAEAVSACHCAICRRWTGAAMFEIEAADVRVSGKVATYRSSSFAERAFCPVCGTHLWIRDDDGPHELMPGLFDAAAGFPLSHEVYADRAFACVALQGDHARIDAAAYEAANAFVEDPR